MQLYYSSTSPYSRKVLVFAYELEIIDSLELIQVHPFDDPIELRQNNPLGKVPTLILDNGEPLYDSPVIVNYLQILANKTAFSVENFVSQNRLQALGDGIMDAALSLVLENRRIQEQRSPFWQQRWEESILRSLKDFEEKYINDAQQWHIGSIAMVCSLDYLLFRLPINDWTQKYPKSANWFQVMMERQSMKITDPRN
ncbi:MAG: glutathione S-transferase [Okeania sp. SIO3H1]|nr:glutathione S-transferase [Okeania sp. SIO3H1]